MITYWYVDYENVNTVWFLNSISNSVKKNDVVIVFYSAVTPTIPLRFLHQVEIKGGKIRVVPCATGSKNAMDFQIVMEVAANCQSGKQIAHRVVSRDTGYDAPLKAWRSRGYDVALCIPSDKESMLTFCI